MADLALYLAEKRTAKNMSRRHLAELAGISHTEIHRIENGERKLPSPPVLKAIASALEVPYEEIMQAAGYLEEVAPKVEETSKLENIEDLSDEEIEQINKYIRFLRHSKENS